MNRVATKKPRPVRVPCQPLKMKDLVREKMGELNPIEQIEVLDFVKFLIAKRQKTRHPFPRLHGALAEPGLDITEEQIDEARREMWGGYARKAK